MIEQSGLSREILLSRPILRPARPKRLCVHPLIHTSPKEHTGTAHFFFSFVMSITVRYTGILDRTGNGSERQSTDREISTSERTPTTQRTASRHCCTALLLSANRPLFQRRHPKEKTTTTNVPEYHSQPARPGSGVQPT